MASVPQPKKKTLLFSAKSPGPTNYFDPDSYSFLENKLVMQLIDRGEVELKLSDIPYIVLIDVMSETFFDTTTQSSISEKAAKELTNSGKAELRVSRNPLSNKTEQHNRDTYLTKDTSSSNIGSRSDGDEEQRFGVGVATPRKTVPTDHKKKKRQILCSKQSPGPTHYFDTKTSSFLDETLVDDLIHTGVAEIQEADIPHVILVDESNTTEVTYYDTTTQRLLSKDEAYQLCHSRNAQLVPMSMSTGPNEDEKNSSEEKERPDELDTKAKVLIGATAAGGTTAAAAAAISAPFLAGFTSSGIAAGSMAAGIQSAIGSVTAGSGFAFMQSLAATTLIGTALPVAAAGVAVAGTATAGILLHKHIKKIKSKNKDQYGLPSNNAKIAESVEGNTLSDDDKMIDLTQNGNELPPSYDADVSYVDILPPAYEENARSFSNDTSPPGYDFINDSVSG